MRRSDSLARIALFVVGLSPGCAWITEHSKVQDEYERQVMVAAERAALVEAQLAEAQTRIAALEETVRLHGQSESQRVETVDEINGELARLRGLIEEIQFQVAAQQKYLDETGIDHERRALYAERRLTQLETYLHVKPPPPPTDEELGVKRDGTPAVTNPDGTITNPDGTTTNPDGTTTNPDGTVTNADGTILHPDGSVTKADGTVVTPATVPNPDEVPPATADAALELAVSHMKANRPGVARAVLQKALDDFPTAPEKPEIIYRIGETYFNEQDYRSAAKWFGQVVKGYPKTDWAAWSMLRQGECFEAMGRKDDAKVFYQSVVDTYPKAAAAVDAKKKLGP